MEEEEEETLGETAPTGKGGKHRAMGGKGDDVMYSDEEDGLGMSQQELQSKAAQRYVCACLCILHWNSCAVAYCNARWIPPAPQALLLQPLPRTILPPFPSRKDAGVRMR